MADKKQPRKETINELKSKCHGARVYEAQFYSSKKEGWFKSFFICDICNDPCKVEKIGVNKEIK